VKSAALVMIAGSRIGGLLGGKVNPSVLRLIVVVVGGLFFE
jgi:hypothetical protein